MSIAVPIVWRDDKVVEEIEENVDRELKKE